jgi:phospholipid N-methyltransferase
MQSDSLMFFRTWVVHPFQVAAVVPSGRALAEIITREITPQTGHVIELGPGTGVFTTKMIERGLKPENLTLIEYSPEFAERLKKRFPGARVLSMDAARLNSLEFPQEAPVGAVVSGIPLLTMPTRKVMSILDRAFKRLGSDGAFYQFTYMNKCPVPRPILDRLGLRATLVDRTLLNFPPAAVYRISSRRARQYLQAAV